VIFLRRLFGLGQPDDRSREPAEVPEPPLGERPEAPESAARPIPLACPSCAVLLDPPPPRNRLCPRCRQPIVVRRIDGRVALLTEASVAVFDAERRREADLRAWSAERRRWLGLARSVKASPSRRAKLAAAPLSAEVVSSSRALYLAAAAAAVRAAKREKRIGDVGLVLREQAQALYEEAGSPVPVPDDILRMHREGMTAVLRSLQPFAKEVELVSAGCCAACRSDDGKSFRTTGELRANRLPHAGCPNGLCGCDWWPVTEAPKKKRTRRPAKPATEATEATEATIDLAESDAVGDATA